MNFNFTATEIQEQALTFMRDADLAPRDERDTYLKLDGQLHRYAVEGDKGGETSGAYVIHSDGFPAGYFQNWRTGVKLNWRFNAVNLTPEQQAYLNSDEYKKAEEAKRKKREAEEKKRRTEASEKARILYESYLDGDFSHPYLIKKDVKRHADVRLDVAERRLVIPLRNVKGDFLSLQWISEDGGKRFYYGAPLEGAFFGIGIDKFKGDDNKNNIIILAEGYATAAKVHQLTGRPVIATMTCGNLEPVAKAVKAAFSNARIIVAADNDAKTQQERGFNPGITSAKMLVSKELAIDCVVPEFEKVTDGTDWDDYALKYGVEKATKVLGDAIALACMNKEEREEKGKKDTLASTIHTLDPAIQIPPQEFIGGLFPRKFITLLAAPPGTGKTMFIQRAASDLSMGGTFFDGFEENEPPRTCLIFAGEAGYEMLIRRGASLKWRINPQKVLVVDQHEFEYKNIAINIDEEEGWRNVERLVEMYSPDIVFWDTFSSFHEKDENKANEMKPLVKKIARLASEKNLAAVLVHHSRKRASSERNLSLNQDDVIGSSILNRLVALIIGIEPMKAGGLELEQEKKNILLVSPLKTWFSPFMPFTYRMTESLYGQPVMETDLAPDLPGNPKTAVWNYLTQVFTRGEWFTTSQIILSEIKCDISSKQLINILQSFLKNNKLVRRGAKKTLEYSLP